VTRADAADATLDPTEAAAGQDGVAPNGEPTSGAEGNQQRTSLFEDLSWRGLIYQSTGLDELKALFDGPPMTYYVGFDPTAPSLHIGNLVQLLTARRIQDAGHLPLGLVGGSTGLIGDPKMAGERVLNSPETVANWVNRIHVQVERFLEFEGANAARIVNNLDWTAPMSAIEFLRDIGKHFRMGKMLAKDVVAKRLDSADGLSFTEFSYQILQGMDFLELFRRYSCVLQFGGSDQWGNLISGTELIHKVEGANAQAFATPLITKADGTKFGKTEGGAVWLDPSMTSPWTFYQFWINSDDRDVLGYLKVFSFRSRAEIEALEQATAERPHAREAQRALASDVTTLVHGADATRSVIAASTALFGRGDLASVDESILAAALTEAGATTIDTLTDVVDLFARSGLVSSRSEARRALAEGGLNINNVRITDEHHVPADADLLHGTWLVLRRGKRSIAGVRRSI
jgi:tyrosyl-tRNA synthetase